ncbi:MAG: hypothetical protein IIU51_06165, partial [Bacteroidaceae bacterium]|nr:hypothetical protein [Bacteroidaceae bacterium]
VSAMKRVSIAERKQFRICKMQKCKITKTQKCKNAKTAMRGEKIFYTEKRRRHRHAREIFFHREAVKISSGGKNPGQFTQTEVIPIIFYTLPQIF